MNEIQQEAFETVEKFNDKLSEKYKDDIDHLPILSVTFGSYYTFISLSTTSELDIPEINLYNSVDDDRIYYQETDEYETLYKLIKRKFKLIKEELNKIKL